ncbi:MAG: hypothetical protein ACRDKS_17890 [Actinomycetota bacterium]
MKVSRRFVVAILAVALVAVVAAPSVSGAGLLSGALQWKPLVSAAPSWYTTELHQKVLAANHRPVALPAGVSAPTSSLAFLGIRPGQLLIIEGGTLCTSNFVFTNGSQFFIGTAGHCGGVGAQATMLYLPGGLVDIGTIVRSTGDAGIGNDFALIAIDPSLSADVTGSMAYWGGPTGVYTGSGPAVVQHTGWGLVIGTGGTPRVGLGLTWTPNEWIFEGAITPGDSGSGAIVLGGLAAGNITHLAVNGGLFPPVFLPGTSMTKIMQYAAGTSLVTCPALPSPLIGC